MTISAFDVEDTIVAIASAPGSAPRGIIRLSGPDSLCCVADAAKIAWADEFESRRPFSKK